MKIFTCLIVHHLKDDCYFDNLNKLKHMYIVKKDFSYNIQKKKRRKVLQSEKIVI